MSPADQNERVSALFAEIFDLTPGEQQARLASCDDPAVQQEVASLLDFDREADGQLSSSDLRLTSVGAGDPAQAHLPEQIGAYRIVGVLGRGGMGNVFEAEQENPKRRVALKVVNSVMASADLRRRFEHEAHVLGLLQHSGIAQIIEAGTFDAGMGEQPFFAMEHVEGEILTHHATNRSLSLRDRLALFAKVCDAIHHAHQRGIVHRDLKPANILVTPEGNPKVLDFGVARVATVDQDHTQLTADGQILGTLGYMSPEQARGDVDLDTSSDVYSLGVVLYELLSGDFPYRVTGLPMHDAVRTILDTEAAPLSAHDPRLGGDVDTMVRKALQKEKERRYESAAALATDIRRYLQNEPITARRPTTIYTLQKFARRNRPLVAGVTAAFVALIIALVVTIRLNDQKGAALALATKESAEKERQRANADAVARFLSDLFADSKPDDRGIEDISALQILDQGYAQLEDYADGDPLRRAMLMEALGSTYRSVSIDDRAEELLRGALAIRQEHLGADHADTLSSMNGLGILLRKTGRPEEAIALYRLVLDGRKKIHGKRSESVAKALNNLSVALRSLGENEEALLLLGEGTEIMLEVVGPEDTQTITHRANYGLNLAMVDDEESIPLLEDLHALSTRVHGEKHTATLHVGYCLGIALIQSNRDHDAIEVLEPVLAGQREVNGERSSEATSTWYTLGDAYLDSGDPETAARYLRTAHELGTERLGPDHSWVFSCRRKEADALQKLGRLDEAEGAAKECELYYVKRYGDEHQNTVRTREILKAIAEARANE